MICASTSLQTCCARATAASALMLGMITAKVAELAHDHLEAERRGGGESQPEITGPNVKAWLAQSFFGGMADPIMTYAVLEADVMALKKEYGDAQATQEANAIVRSLTPMDLATLLEPVKLVFTQRWQPESEADRRRLHEQALRVLVHTVEKAVCERQPLGDTSTEISVNLARAMITNVSECNTVIKKLGLNRLVHQRAGDRKPTLQDLVDVAQGYLAEGSGGGYASDPRNAPNPREIAPAQDNRPFTERPGNVPGERKGRELT